jgi:hypothetical protein
MAFRSNLVRLTGLVAIVFSALTQSGQSSSVADEASAKASCEASRTSDQQCVVIKQKFANSNFSSAPFNFAPFGPQNPEPTSCLVQIDPCPSNQTVPVHNASPTGANAESYTGEGTAGKFTGNGMSQSVLTFPLKPCKLDDETPGFEMHLIGHVASTQFDSGDLLFEHGGSNAILTCIDFNSGRFDAYGTVDIIGGLGKYDGAQGKATVEQHGQFMVFPGAPINNTLPPYGADGSFGFWHGSSVATFTTPQK